MKLTVKQLKQLIKEQVEEARLRQNERGISSYELADRQDKLDRAPGGRIDKENKAYEQEKLERARRVAKHAAAGGLARHGSTEGEDNKSTSFRDSLADMLDELVDATTNATVYDDIPELRAKADRHLAAVKVKILNQVVSQIDYAKNG